MLQARMFFGIKTQIKDNLWSLSDEEILYVAGGVIVIHNFVNKSQRYINIFNPERRISLVTVSKDK